jgi:hypothetical protein
VTRCRVGKPAKLPPALRCCNFRPADLVWCPRGADTRPRRPTLIRRNRKLFVHLLSLALLFAQFGMLAHASTHLRADPHAAPSAAQLCGECLSFSPLQNIVAGPPTALLIVKPPIDRIYEGEAVAAVLPRAFSAFRSRAPPIVL